MRQKDLKIAEKFKSLVEQRAKVHEVKIFGSRARGEATEESDLDVLIVVDHLDHELEKFISECAWEAGFPEDVVVMPVAVSIDTIKNSPLRDSVFFKTVYREGVAV